MSDLVGNPEDRFSQNEAQIDTLTVLFQADVILIMTCSIREGAEQKIWKKLHYLKKLKSKRKSVRKGGIPMKIGVLGNNDKGYKVGWF